MASDADTRALRAIAQVAVSAITASAAPKASRPAGPSAPDDLGPLYAAAKQWIRREAAKDPLDAILGVSAAGTLMFYLAEKGHNPKCESLADAAVFVTTSLSVGYDNKFPVTPTGKAIASLLQIVGPALAAKALDPPAAEAPAPAATDNTQAVVERLDAILEILKRSPNSPSAPAA